MSDIYDDLEFGRQIITGDIASESIEDAVNEGEKIPFDDSEFSGMLIKNDDGDWITIY